MRRPGPTRELALVDTLFGFRCSLATVYEPYGPCELQEVVVESEHAQSPGVETTDQRKESVVFTVVFW